MADEFAKRAAAMKARIEERRTNSSARGLGTSGTSIGATTPSATATTTTAPTSSAATNTSSPSETPASTTPTGATPTVSPISSGPRASMARGSAGGAPRGSFRTPNSGRLGAGAAGSPTGPGAANQRNLQLANTELKMLQMKYDAEVRRRQSLEEQLKAANEARDSAAASPSASRQDSAPKVGGATRVSMAPGSRSSRQSVAPGAKGINILETISRVLVEMEKLEGNFRRAEAGRAQAETELLEVAMMKQVADENLQTLHSDLNRIISNFESQLQTFQSLIIAMDKSGLEQLKTTLERTHGELKARVSEASQQGSTERVNKRATVLLQQINLGGPPPPGPPPPSAPPLQSGPPGPPRGGPTRAPGSIRGPSGGGDNNPRASTLLSQIRRGKDLNKIDIDEVKRERQRTIQNNRQSMALFSSLQDTLRAALNCRQDNMNLYNDDTGDDWDD